ncbi:hypothetical protein LCGC14_1188200 [marine sediment metagenome]|uniref:3D domain-containing protein n=1 Tax=marine sediment metagenome TaxID=412755 RepID=A0A0F9LQ18_9ZZZZ
MNKYNISPEAYKATQLIVTCIIAGLCLWAAYGIVRVFSPQSRVPAGPPSVGPAQLYRVTAYCPCKICCGRWADGYTASGKPAVGLIVAAPPNIPFGTVLGIPGYSLRAVVQDRGGAITGDRLDVLFATHQEALNWGVQELMVKEVR